MTTDARLSSRLSVPALIATAILWSTGSVLIKFVSWNPVAIAGMRSAISSVVILAAVRKPKFNFSPAQIGGAVCFSATVILFVSAVKFTTAANAILLQYTSPVYTALFARRFLNEKTSTLDWLLVAVMIGGVSLFFFDQLTPGGYFGNVLALLSGIGHAGLVLFLRKQKEGSAHESVLLGNVLTAFIGLPFMFSGRLLMHDWIGLASLGIVQLGLSFVLYAWAIKQVKALDAMLIFMIEPIISPVWVFLFIGERPGQWALFGGVVVLASVTFRCVHALRNGSGERGIRDIH